jgi:hypothetical protein
MDQSCGYFGRVNRGWGNYHPIYRVNIAKAMI